MDLGLLAGKRLARIVERVWHEQALPLGRLNAPLPQAADTHTQKDHNHTLSN